MPSRLRVQFEGTIYHAMSRGNGRQEIAFNDRVRGHFVDLLGAQVGRPGRELISFVLLSNHFHAQYALSPADLARRGAYARPRAVAAWLGRCFASARLEELCRTLGYDRPRCIAEVLGRLEDWNNRDSGPAGDLAAIQDRLRARHDRG
jgi:hypothetical protein